MGQIQKRQERANRAIPYLWTYHMDRLNAEGIPARIYDEPQSDSCRELIADLQALQEREGWQHA